MTRPDTPLPPDAPPDAPSTSAPPLPAALHADHHRQLMEGVSDLVALKYLRRFLCDFAADPTGIDDAQADWLLARGFLPEKTVLYDFATHDAELYLSDVQRWMTREINGDYTIVFNNKILFTQIFRNFCKVAPVTAIWRNGRVIAYDDSWHKCLRGAHEGPVRFVIKPLGGGGGGNVYFVQVGRERAVVESNEAGRARFTLPVGRLEEIFSDARVPFMVTEFIAQGAFARALYPLTVNTLRMLVVRDPDTLLPHVVRCVQRIGTGASYPIDNFSMGGLSAEIDLDTGILGPALAAAGPARGQRWECHPETGAPIAGQQVPGWEGILAQMKALFLQIPYIAYCGFDLILTDDGLVVLEGNSYSQVRLFQMHRPLLTDPTYVRVLEHAGIMHRPPA